MPPLSKTIRTFLIASGAMLLVMMLFYPFGYDQAAFSVGGDMVLKNGAVPFRDFLDTKPPFIFYIYSVALFIFGHHDWSIRAFDILFHFAALFYFYKVLVNVLKNEDHALLSCFLYVILYTTSGYWMTAQAETFALLPSLVVFYHTLRFLSGKGKLLGNALAIGLASTTLFFLKSTLIMVPAASLLILLLRTTKKKRYAVSALSVFFFVLSSSLYLLYLSSVGAYDRWVESLEWVQHYADLSPLFSPKTVREVYFQLFPEQLVGSFTFTFVILGAFGVAKLSNASAKNSVGNINNHLLLQLAFGLLGVLLERKCFPYHYSRTFWAAAPLIAIGLVHAFIFFRDEIRTSGGGKKLLVIFFLAIALFYSPFMRLLSQPLRWTYMTISGADKALRVQKEHGSYPLKDQQILADKYKDSISTNDNVFFWGNHVGVLFYLDKLPTTIALTNTPLVTDWTADSWRDTMMMQLQRSKPMYFIVEQNDVKTFINNSTKDSYGQLQQWRTLWRYLLDEYNAPAYEHSFLIFKRRVN